MDGKLPPGNNANNQEVQAYQDNQAGVVKTKPVGKFRNRNVKQIPLTVQKIVSVSHKINDLKDLHARSSSQNSIDREAIAQFEQRLKEINSHLNGNSDNELTQLLQDINQAEHKPLAPSKVSEFMPEFTGQLEPPPTVEQAQMQLKEIYRHNRLRLEIKFKLATFSNYLATELKRLNENAIDNFDKEKNIKIFFKETQKLNKEATKILNQIRDEENKRKPLNTEYAKRITSEFNTEFECAFNIASEIARELQEVRKRACTLTQDEFKQFCSKQKDFLASWQSEVHNELTEIEKCLQSLDKKTEGAFGTVQAFDSGQLSTKKDSKKLHKRYALKTLKSPQELGPLNEPTTYDSEIKMAAQSSSPVVLHTNGKVGEDLLMLMDDGGSDLFSILDFKGSTASNPISNGLKKAVLKSAAEQLSDLHQKNIAHRDIKLENILINAATGEVGLIDYGFSEQSDLDSYSGSPGSPAYAAPEIKKPECRSKKTSKKTDVFSLGVLFYEVLTGRLSELDLIRMSRNKHKIQCKEMLNTVGQKYGNNSLELQLIRQMIEYDPKKRLSMSDVVAHPFFHQTKKSYAELNAIHRAKIKEMGKMETEFKKKNKTIENNKHYKQLRRDLDALQSALQWHELESQKNSVVKAGKLPKNARAEHISDQERQNIIDDIKSQQQALLIQADNYL